MPVRIDGVPPLNPILFVRRITIGEEHPNAQATFAAPSASDPRRGARLIMSEVRATTVAADAATCTMQRAIGHNAAHI
jgi:hypothetical protein